MADEKKDTGGTYYAWSKFKKEVNEWGQVTEWINPGDSVSQGDLDVGDDEWQYLIDSGAVREEEYPENLPPDVSPAEYYAANPEEAQKAAEGQVDTSTPSAEAMPKTENPPGTTQAPGTGTTQATQPPQKSDK